MPLPSSRDREQIKRGLTEFLTDKTGTSVTIDKLDVPEGAGFSSETFLFDASWDGGGGRFVTRMGPVMTDMPVFAKYDLSLQVNAMALVRSRTDVPVPNVRWYEPSDEPLGGEFYVMDYVEGTSAPDNPPYVFGSWVTEATPEQRRRVQDHTADIMAKLHAIEIDDGARTFLDRPEHGATPLEQHLAHQRWYYDWAREGEDYPIIAEALDWLERNRPSDDPVGLNWGDARIGNIMFRDFEPVAVVDWEMACLGAPEADVTWVLMLHHFFLDILNRLGMENPFPEFFSIPEYVGRYEERSGRTLSNLEWYYTFNHLRFAIISVRTSRRAIVVGDMPPPESPSDIVSNRGLLEASMKGTNPYWVT